MQFSGPTNEERGSHPPSSTTATPFTFTFTRVQTRDSKTAPFLRLPAELRNKIYELAAKDHNCARLFDGQIVLPPLGCVCKKIRAELRGVFEHEVISNIAIVIEARVINFNFTSLFRWLDEHDQQFIPENKHWTPRELKIHVTCRLEPWMTPCKNKSSLRRSTSKEVEALPPLLLQNLSITMSGWDWNRHMFDSTSYGLATSRTSKNQHQQLVKTVGVNSENIHSRCKRARTGHHYTVAFIADDTWHHLSLVASTRLQVRPRPGEVSATNVNAPILKLYDNMYEMLIPAIGRMSDVDRRLALILREVCQSDCSKSERDAVAGTLDMYLGRIRPFGTQVDLSTTQFWKWNFTMVNRAALEDRRMLEARGTVLAGQSGCQVGEESVSRASKRPRLMAPMPVQLKVTSKAGLPAELTSHRGGAMSEMEEITSMMARWHL